MYLFAIAAGILAFVVWRGRAKPVFRNGGWRAGAGLFAIGMLSAAAILAVRGDAEESLALLVIGGILLFAARGWRRPDVDRLSGPLSASEARAILGVPDNASSEEILKAYARLMQMAHPDRGGTAGLAAQLNAARDRLMNRR